MQYDSSRVELFAILQKYDFSSKSQPTNHNQGTDAGCLRYCKSTIFQANHNEPKLVINKYMLFAILQKYDFSSKSQRWWRALGWLCVVCDTAKVRFFKQITTTTTIIGSYRRCLRYCKSTIFQANHNYFTPLYLTGWLFAIQHNVTTSTHLVTPRDPITQ